MRHAVDGKLPQQSTRSPLPTVLLGVVIILLSSAAPFIRFSGNGIALSPDDTTDALLFAIAWLPMVLAVALFLRLPTVAQRVTSRWLLVASLVLLPVLVVAHTTLFVALKRSIPAGAAFEGVSGIPFLVLTMLGALQYLVGVALFVTEVAGRTAFRAEVAAAELKASSAILHRELLESRMTVLRSQLQPHFLFNALNSISALVVSDPHAARRMLLDLSSLLRMVLDNSERSMVAIEQEMELIRAYLAIQQVRFGDRLDASITIEESARQLAVPPMLLQPIVENAVQHAMTSDDSTVEVSVRAFADNGKLTIDVSNTGPAPAADLDDRGGIGLRNTRDRLQQLFGDNQSVNLHALEKQQGARARISMPAAPMSAKG